MQKIHILPIELQKHDKINIRQDKYTLDLKFQCTNESEAIVKYAVKKNNSA